MFDKDFTMEKYEMLCRNISESDYTPLKIEEVVNLGDINSPKYIVLRHDVDRSPKKALIMAKIENQYKIKSTFYFRTISEKLFDESIINEISRLGHEIGYHYEVLSYARGDYNKAHHLFKESIEKFSQIGIKVKTAAFHGSPISRYNNRDFWEKNDYRNFDLKGLAYDSINFDKVYYITDTGRTFGNTSSNLRDSPQTNFLFSNNLKSTSDLINLIKKDTNNIYITTHPERWAIGSLDWYWELFFQNFKNVGKYFLNYARR